MLQWGVAKRNSGIVGLPARGSKANFTAPGPCADFKAWQATGQDAGSKVLPAPSVEDMVAMGRNILAGKPPQKKDRTKL